MIRTWLRWRRDLRQLEREAYVAHDRWVRARYAYSDAATVFAGQHGRFAEIKKAQDELTDRMDEYLALAAKIRRMREVGP